jgi:hypothetical protein
MKIRIAPHAALITAVSLALAAIGVSAQSTGPSAAPGGSAPPECPSRSAGSTMLPAGCPFSSTGFVVPLTLVPPIEAWVPWLDIERELYLAANLPGGDGGGGAEAVQFIAPDNLFQTPCADPANPGPTDPWTPTLGAAATEFAAWLEAALPGAIVSSTPVSIGGYDGTELLVSAPTGSLDACGGFLSISDAGSPGGQWGIPGGFGRARWDIIEVGDRPVFIETAAQDLDRWDAVQAAADELLATLSFGSAELPPSPNPSGG